MVTERSLSDICTNDNTGIEYEIALFRKLLTKDTEVLLVDVAIQSRHDANTIDTIIRRTSTDKIMRALRARSLELIDVSFETQNDEVGPSDIVMVVKTEDDCMMRIGISVKYANSCTLNLSSKRFLTEQQISKLREMLPRYTDDFIAEMKMRFGKAQNWFHRRVTNKSHPSVVNDAYIDLIRSEAIANWSEKTIEDKRSVLSDVYQEESPIPYWVCTFKKRTSGFVIDLNLNPYKIDLNQAEKVKLVKYQTSYIGFSLDGKIVGKMQVKFNDGFLEKCKKQIPDKIVDGILMSYGKPFGSWNFSIVED